MLRPVTENDIMLRVIATFQDEVGLSKGSPPALHSAYLMLRQNLRTVRELLAEMGFVVAEEAEPTGTADLSAVLTIFATGQAHAPGRTAILQDAWPALYEALDQALHGGPDGE